MAEIRRSPVEVGSLSHDLQGLDIPGAGFINSSSGIMKRNPFGGGIKEAANVSCSFGGFPPKIVPCLGLVSYNDPCFVIQRSVHVFHSLKKQIPRFTVPLFFERS